MTSSPFVLKYDTAASDLRELFSLFASVTALSKRRRWELEREWKRKFVGTPATPLPQAVTRGPLWHYFSYGIARASHGAVAQQSYGALHDTDYLVLPETPNNMAIACQGRLPTLGEWREVLKNGLPFDITLLSTECLWTYVITHEDPDIGPFFSVAISGDGVEEPS